ncbi:hypothetical protein DdX_05157 [Ditylenchus destructor]|uniref:Uncharacterized protein n=1 Tax=Ditylenchus destructor TaxID=166010 RepID=A0AAD4NBA5_9BILA|nr:hypothetical protein DdX_05157 [Ditylenchus destructor]
METFERLRHRKRLSCSGIAFAIHGLDSIGTVLENKLAGQADNNQPWLDTKLKTKIFRRLYARLIEPIDEIADRKFPIGDGQTLVNIISTREAQLLAMAVDDCIPGNRADVANWCESEKLANFMLALHFTRIFYAKFVLSLYPRFNT